MHLYLVVDCKTPNCGTAHVLMYLGEKGKVPDQVEYWIPYPLKIGCPSCGKTHDYSDSGEELLAEGTSAGSPARVFQ
jgi:hypothetical protein